METATDSSRAQPDISHVNPADADVWFGHPRQLARLFTTEMWERFGYYGIRALLVVYLTKFYLFDDVAAGGLYGAFIGLAYLTPVIGGLIADRILGSKGAVKLGAIIMSVGYLGLCFGGEQAKPVFIHGGQTYAVQVSTAVSGREEQYVVTSAGNFAIRGQADGSIRLEGATGQPLPPVIAKGDYRTDGVRSPFWISLMLLSMSLIIVGNGLFKPNISTMVGSLYPPGDRRRDAGFTIFYMGINLGSIGSQLIAPLLARALGWWAGFGLVAVGMVVAWSLFQFDKGKLAGYGERPASSTPRARLLSYVALAAAVPVSWLLLNNTLTSAAAASEAAAAGSGVIGYLAALPLLGKALLTCFAAAAIGMPIWAFRAGSRAEFQMMLVASILIVMSVVFWTLFELAGSALTLFAERSVDRSIFGWDMPGGSVQVFNPIFIVTLAPVMAALWVWLGKRRAEPSIPVKFAIGLTLVGLGFLVLPVGALFADGQYRVALIWMVILYLLHSIGELCLSPVGLSMITKLSIARVVGMMMGVWFLSISMANYAGGLITQLTSVSTVGGEVTNPKLALDTYLHTFTIIGIAAVAIGIGLLLVSPLLKKWMHGVQ
ncbi:peptide MFS transporter [Sphingomonas sp.]|uniref:peptide MFS transporter n=1 Tax=Sphingomonas sp. TaxID=28214 RepID=UPI000DB3E7DB|nr:peptide MFS transporter [Sphingomonas sp.]PZU10701.1 MAG: MFS transporter [Sphingomonas sp.]